MSAFQHSASRRTLPTLAAAFALVLSCALPAFAADTLPIQAKAGSTVWIDGTSNVHDWSSTASKMDLSFRGEAIADHSAGALLALMKAGKVQGMDLVIPVAGMKSKKDGLDKNMQKALKAEAHPNIEFKLDTYEVVPAAGDSFTVKMKGNLTVSGQTKPAMLQAMVVPGPDGVWVKGKYDLKMTDFGIKPPTMMMGALRTADKVSVSWRMLLDWKH